jgi:hypothetical protein
MKWHGTGEPRHQNQLSINYLTLRKVLGWIGVLLPFGLLAGNALFASYLPDSMSGYYDTAVRDLFIGALCALGVFLIGYAGFDDWDRWLTNVAGGGAILVREGGVRTGEPRHPTQCRAGSQVAASASCGGEYHTELQPGSAMYWTLRCPSSPG